MTKRVSNQKHPGSFQDPSGFVFTKNAVVFRQVNQVYRKEYNQLMGSGLYQALVDRQLLLPHTELGKKYALTKDAYQVIKPDPVPFVSYPYEWSFSQLKAAALTSLTIQKISLGYGMTLKDASAYNLQFLGTKPIFIDTLSFANYQEGKPWVAYQQFCQHFLAPLAIISYTDVRLGQLQKTYLDGIPLDLAVTLLPWRARLNLSLLSHLNLQTISQKRLAGTTPNQDRFKISRRALLALVGNLESAVTKLDWQPTETDWSRYYQKTSYSPTAFNHKKQLVAHYLDKIRPQTVWDLGANLGQFSRIAAKKGAFTIALDNDPSVVEKLYLDCQAKGEQNILPLVIDLVNPSPGLGWANQERQSLLERGPADAILALALIHHLVIACNVPLDLVADFFSRAGRSLIIEFVPASDSQAQKLMAAKKTVHGYDQEGFEGVFGKRFKIVKKTKINRSGRFVYLMTKSLR